VVETWDSFGVVVGGASGALIGLLFVAISVDASRIAKHPALHVVASRTLVLFGIPLVASILVVTPHQADWALGTELIVLGVVAGAALILVGRVRMDSDASPESRLARTLDRTSPTFATSLGRARHRVGCCCRTSTSCASVWVAVASASTCSSEISASHVPSTAVSLSR
jgi:hypothetical protein